MKKSSGKLLTNQCTLLTSILILLLLNCAMAWAGPVGDEFQVNTYTTNHQEFPSTAMDSAGNFVIVWQCNSIDDDRWPGIYAQRYDASGTPQGSEFRVNPHTMKGTQSYPSVAMDSSGNFVVVWRSNGQDGSSSGIYAKRYDASGTPQGSEFRVNSNTMTSTQPDPSVAVAMDSSGNFVVVWQSDDQDGSSTDIFAQRYDASGIPQGNEFQVNDEYASYYKQPAVAMNSTGDFVIVYHMHEYGEGGIRAKQYNALGIPQGNEFQANDGNAPCYQPAVAMDSSGYFVITWSSYKGGGSLNDVYAKRYNASAVPEGSEFLVNTYTEHDQHTPTIDMEPSGNFVIAWSDYEQEGDSSGVYAQCYDASGTPEGYEFHVNSYTALWQGCSSVAMNSSGDFIVTWASRDQDGDDQGVYAQRFTCEYFPVASITSPNYGRDYTTNDNSPVTISGTCNADTETIQVNGSTIGVAYTTGESSWLYISDTLLEGVNTFIVTGVDEAGNSNLSDFINITCDMTPPDNPVIITNGGNDFITNKVIITMTGTCSTDTMEILLNGIPLSHTSGDTLWFVDVDLSEQTNFIVTAIDVAGNESETSINITYDPENYDPGNNEENIWYVDKKNTLRNEDGTSWETAFTEIQYGIDAAFQATKSNTFELEPQVWVAAGTYDEVRTSEPHGDGVNTGSVMMKEGIHIYGGFAGTETELTERDWVEHGTIIDGTEGAIHVVVGADNSTLDGFTITGGNASGREERRYGGGMYNQNSSPTLANCTFTNNRGIYGGGMCNDSASPKLINCTFSNNHSHYGAGMNNLGSSPRLKNCIFAANSGMAMHNYSSSPRLTNCIFSANTKVGMYNDNSSSPRLKNCTFSGNFDGSIENHHNSSPQVTNSILWSFGKEIHNYGECITIVTYSCIQGDYDGNGNINTNPLFADPTRNDFRIALGSPCIDVGTPSGAPEDDIIGTERPQGAGVDIGAYEYFPGQDSDMNGITDEEEGTADTDGDGIPDVIDLDNDGDYMLDIMEGHDDPDSDGIPSYMDADGNGDGIPDAEQRPVVYVDKDNTASVENGGASWDTAFTTIQAGINASTADGGGDVWVASGTYTGTGDKNIFEMKEDVHIYGGFSGTETEREQRDREMNETIIDGENTRRCVTGIDNAILDGFTITRGGMDNYNSAPKVINCKFLENNVGDGMYNYECSPEIINCTFTENDGISMHNDHYSMPTVTNCTFTENDGISMYNNTSSVTKIINCTFYKNNGISMHNDNYSSPTITNCTFVENDGFCMYNDWITSPIILNCTFVNNNLAIRNGNASTTVTNCILWDNLSTIFGSGSVKVTYSCVEGGYYGEGNIDVDPMLIGSDWGDPHPHPSSPCVNTATSEGAPTIDINGITRPQGTGIDMGAYEVDENAQLAIIEVLLTVDSSVNDQCQWRVNGGAWRENGTSVEVYSGDYVIEFRSNLVHYETPAAQSVIVEEGSHVNVTADYVYSIGANIWRVNEANTSGTEDGTRWATAYTSIQDGVDAAAALGGCEVWVAEGVYTGTGDNAVAMEEDIHLYGGFAGTETFRDQRDWTFHETVIDGEDMRRCVLGGNNAKLDGFIVSGGSAVNGAGMYNGYCTSTITNCTFTGNTADDNGGGMCNKGSSLTVTNCIFTYNSATPGGHGGGIYNSDSSFSALNCLFLNNYADNFTRRECSDAGLCYDRSYGGRGGGIYNLNSICDVKLCTFARNKAGLDGSAIYGPYRTITNSIFWDLDTDIITSLITNLGTVSFSNIEWGFEGDGNINMNPMFVDPDNDDFRLQSTSPCIDAGTLDGALDYDLDGILRPQGAGVDMGAYEYVPPYSEEGEGEGESEDEGEGDGEGVGATEGAGEGESEDEGEEEGEGEGEGDGEDEGEDLLEGSGVAEGEGEAPVEPEGEDEGEGEDMPPVITMLGVNPVILDIDESYVEPGASASDDVDGDITDWIVISGEVDVTTVGTYFVFYDVSDSSGNAAETVWRTVYVEQSSDEPYQSVVGVSGKVIERPGIVIDVPENTFESSTVISVDRVAEMFDEDPPAGISTIVETSVFEVTGLDSMVSNQSVFITLDYPDGDHDGIVDGTQLDELDLVVFAIDPDTNDSMILEGEVDFELNTITFDAEGAVFALGAKESVSIIFALGETSDADPEGEGEDEGEGEAPAEPEGEDETPINLQCNGSGLGTTGSSSGVGDIVILLTALTLLVFLKLIPGTRS